MYIKRLLIAFCLLVGISASAQNTFFWTRHTPTSVSNIGTIVDGKIYYDQVLGFQFREAGIWKPLVTPVAYGTASQIPFSNLTGNGFSYNANLSYTQATNRFYAGSGFTVTGSGTIDNLTILGTSNTLSGGSASMRWNYIAGEVNTMSSTGVGGVFNSSIFGGNSNNITASGFNIFNAFVIGGAFNNVTAPTAQTNAQLVFGRFNDNSQSYAIALGYRARATGIGSFAFGTTPGTSSTSNETTIEKITAAGRHAINMSANSSSQIVGHGAYADYSGIFAGIDHDIPSTSPRSVIMGGTGIKARPNDPDQAYVMNLNIENTPLNDDALLEILARDPVSKRVKFRNASTLAGWLKEGTTNLVGETAINAGPNYLTLQGSHINTFIRFDPLNNLDLTAEGTLTLSGNGPAIYVGNDGSNITMGGRAVFNYVNAGAAIHINPDDEDVVSTVDWDIWGNSVANKLRIKLGGVVHSFATETYVDARELEGSSTLDFPNTTTGVSDLTITVTGAALNDVCSVGVPHGSVTATGSYWCWVSAANTVTVRFSPKATTGEDPASGTFKVSIAKP